MEAQLKNETVNNFIIEMTLINPIENILTKLKNGEFRDCDINWLNSKLNSFIELAGQTLGINNISSPRESDIPKYANTSYFFDYYNKYFSNLLEYFKSF